MRTRAECVALDRGTDHWNLQIREQGVTRTEQAKVLVNAAGPWVDPVTALYDRSNHAAKLRLVKGSHIVVKRKYQGDHSYIFQNSDGRIILPFPMRTITR
ncbi:FAD-dependent oxidoreductase [Sphingopyxis sp. BSNA05]|uniref:FAD-dependent oxidoreductase n=1 Tax=Sphingopyxis sp. BSNA05 TaxID=1236614 RepID=UPI00349FC618